MIISTLSCGTTVEIHDNGELFAKGFNTDISEVYGWVAINQDIRDKVIDYVRPNRFSGLYSDHDPDEPSNIRYLTVVGTKIEEVTRLDLLVAALNAGKRIYYLIEECYC